MGLTNLAYQEMVKAFNGSKDVKVRGKLKWKTKHKFTEFCEDDFKMFRRGRRSIAKFGYQGIVDRYNQSKNNGYRGWLKVAAERYFPKAFKDPDFKSLRFRFKGRPYKELVELYQTANAPRSSIIMKYARMNSQFNPFDFLGLEIPREAVEDIIQGKIDLISAEAIRRAIGKRESGRSHGNPQPIGEDAAKMFRMKFYDGRRPTDIAKELGVSRQCVDDKIKRFLKRRLKEYETEKETDVGNVRQTGTETF